MLKRNVRPHVFYVLSFRGGGFSWRCRGRLVRSERAAQGTAVCRNLLLWLFLLSKGCFFFFCLFFSFIREGALFHALPPENNSAREECPSPRPRIRAVFIQQYRPTNKKEPASNKDMTLLGGGDGCKKFGFRKMALSGERHTNSCIIASTAANDVGAER